MKLDSPEILDEFLAEQAQYSADFKALVLRIYVQNKENIQETISLTGVSERSLYTWISAWNTSMEKKKL